MRSVTTNQLIAPEDPTERPFTIGHPCQTHINVVALHTSTSYWGADALEFNPARWLRSVNGKEAPEELITPPRGVFLGWSGGPRNCPGQKMAQVEFVSVIATIFSRCKVDAIAKDGESTQQAQQRLLDLTHDSRVVLTLQMTKPEAVNLQWRRR